MRTGALARAVAAFLACWLHVSAMAQAAEGAKQSCELTTLNAERAKNTFAALVPLQDPYTVLSKVSCIDRILNTRINIAAFFNISSILNSLMQQVLNRACSRVTSSWNSFINRIPRDYDIPVDPPNWPPETGGPPGGGPVGGVPPGTVTFQGPGHSEFIPPWGTSVYVTPELVAGPNARMDLGFGNVFDPIWVIVYDPQGRILAEGDFGSNPPRIPLTVTGSYTIEVQHYGPGDLGKVLYWYVPPH